MGIQINRRKFLKLLGAGIAALAVPVSLPLPEPKPEPDIWSQIVNDPDFCSYFDVVSKYDIVMSGSVASIRGPLIIADGFV